MSFHERVLDAQVRALRLRESGIPEMTADEIAAEIAAHGPISSSWRAALLDILEDLERSSLPEDQKQHYRLWFARADVEQRAIDARRDAIWARLSAPTTVLFTHIGTVHVGRGQVAQHGSPGDRPATALSAHAVVVGGHYDTVDAARAAWRDQMGTPCPI